MATLHQSLARSPRFNSALTGTIGVLMVALAVADPESPAIGAPEVAMILGGSVLVLVSALGVWQPERWGLDVQRPWLTALNVTSVLALLVALALQIL